MIVLNNLRILSLTRDSPNQKQEIVISESYKKQELEITNFSSGQIPSLPEYDGEYSVTPSTEEDITLATANKALNDDITVKKIPYAEVSNNKGGITAIIGN